MSDYDPDTRPTIACPNPKCGHSIIIPPLIGEMGDRHPKWQRVEPGTVIPAGQPYRTEIGREANERISQGKKAGDFLAYFIDSSWKPPLVLPTEPTWGIAVRKDFDQTSILAVGDHWRLNDDGQMQGDLCCWSAENVIDFIPYTDEQVARIEAAR